MKQIGLLFFSLLNAVPSKAKFFLVSYSLAHGLLAVVDAVSFGLLAILAAPLITENSISLPLVGDLSGDEIMWALIIICGVIILKSILAVVLTFYGTRQTAKLDIVIGNQLFESYLKSPWAIRITKNSSDLVRIADLGIANTITNFMMPIAMVLSEALSFVTILAVLFIAQPLVALSVLVYLSLVAVFIFFVISKQSKIAGRVAMDNSLIVSRLLTEMVTALKEITIRNKSDEVAATVYSSREKTAFARANFQFLAGVPRYVLEAAVIGGLAVVGAVGYLVGGITTAIAAISLFFVAGFRLVPSLSRFQGTITQTNHFFPVVRKVMDDIVESQKYIQDEKISEFEEEINLEKSNKIVFEKVSYSYTGADKPLFQNFSCVIPLNKKVAIVGSSGAGKTTLLDLLLGLLKPDAGKITVGDIDINNAIKSWQEKIGYLPQEVALFEGTIAQNVALTWDLDRADPDRTREALEKAQLLDLISSDDEGISKKVGERGLSLSGGQRQRLGLARLLYTNPEIIVIDEGTSALDTKTESAIVEEIDKISKGKTLIVVAHRLATIRDYDQIIFMQNGEALGAGSFEFLVKTFPEFAEQAELAGLV